ncbi:hypothetical protein RHSIM_RhsimUnG0204200 [Rhododendron simsii]|uniref:RRM domain-containing protein n=1 Tax=Rhododendron simsii TaxID=118357 RepID=A0A834L3K4_RHOSS|nr:hypothetical protein RHSIM_RhsimUnG0204200 [Rhododendron simsii]
MAAGVEGLGEAAVVQSPETDTAANGNAESVENVDDKESDSKKSEFKMQEIADMLSKLKLNPMAKEFFPSSYLVIGPNRNQFGPADGFSPVNNQLFGDDGYPNNRRMAFCGEFSAHGFNLLLIAEFVAIHIHVFTLHLSSLPMRLTGYVVLMWTVSAGEALNFGGTLIGFYPIKVLPSKTAILPVNPTFLPRSEDEREMCARTVYCTNIDKEISQAAVKFFFESYCGEVSRLRLLGDNVHSTRIAFVEFAMAESAIAALDCSGRILGTQPIRVSPSKTPVRPRVPRPALN